MESIDADLIAMITEEVTYGEPVEAETDLLLTGLVDSIGVIRIVTWIEDHLDIRIDPGDVVLENFQTVARMVAYLRAR
jgi:acyl carrier protein